MAKSRSAKPGHDTGMRVGIEALKLKWVDVDFEESIITVAQSKTTAGLRTLPMTPLVKSALLEWRGCHERDIGVRLFQSATPERAYPQREDCLAQCSQDGGTP
jgi:integrase